MKYLYAFLVLCLFCKGLAAQDVPQQSYQLIKTRNEVQYKNYYLLTLFQQLPALRKMLSTDTTFNNIYKSKTAQVNESVKTCKTDITCYAKALKFTNEEIADIGNRLALLYTENNPLGNLVKNHLIPSGCYAMFAKEHTKPF